MHRLRANIGCGTWLRSRVALPPEGFFLALKREHMGTAAYVLARYTPKSARKTRN